MAEIDAAGRRLPVNRSKLPVVIAAVRRSRKKFSCETPKGTPIITNAKASLGWLAGDIDEARIAAQRIILHSGRASDVVQRICTLFRKADHFMAHCGHESGNR